MVVLNTKLPRASEDAGFESEWHAMSAGEVVSVLDTGAHGLDSADAARRLQHHGRNQLPAPPHPHPLRRFLAQFNNTLIYFLLAAAVAAWFLGHRIDAGVIVAVVTINAIVGFMEEGKAEKALDAIRTMIAARAAILRGGHRRSIPAEDLVPGDVVLLEPGDRVPADLRMLQVRGLRVDEAILTGESVPVEKREEAVLPDAPLGDRLSMAFSGTMVVAGRGIGVVVATGARTEIGRVSRLMGDVQQITTPLLRQINHFGRRFTWTAITAAVLLFAFAVLVRGFAWPDALIAVVALAVGVVPEGLPAVITITLAIGVQRMARRHAVVRRLPAVETLGATSVICSDKTGTLTRNEMVARRIVTAGHEILVVWSDDAPDGALTVTGPDEDVASAAAAGPLFRAALLCNDAHLHRADGTWTVEGDPMEGALLALGMSAGLAPEHVRAEWERIDEVPFDAQRRYMATLNRGPDAVCIFVKGAPERLLGLCEAQLGRAGEEPVDHARWSAAVDAAASEGERVLGFAMRRLEAPRSALSPVDVEGGLVFLGVVGLIDPPREEAVAAVAECRSAGIAVKMITGDHAATARAIARQLGLGTAPEVVTGAELDAVSDEALPGLAERVSVFARTSPEHKLRIVRALQADGAIVAMTGDGVNDAPSLKQADVGIAMGRKGTEAAKEASEIVLLDDNFASIVAAVHEGRTVYDNIRKVIAWTIPTNGGEVLTVIAAILFGFTLPMTAAQILWINLILTVTLGLVLAFEPAEPGVMGRPPRPSSAPLLSPFLVWRVFFVSGLFVAGALTVFFYALAARGLDVDTARTLVVNTIVVLEIFYLFNVRYLHMTSITWRGALGTPAVLAAIAVVTAAQFAFTYAPFMHELFATRPVALLDGVVVVLVGVALMLILEAEKVALRRLGLFRTET